MAGSEINQIAPAWKLGISHGPLREALAMLEHEGLVASVLCHRSTVGSFYRSMGTKPIRTEQRAHIFQWMKLLGLIEVVGHTLGIVGFGEFGNETACRAVSFSNAGNYNKCGRLSSEIAEIDGVSYAGLDKMFCLV